MYYGLLQKPAEHKNDCIVIGIFSDNVSYITSNFDPKIQQLVDRANKKIPDAGNSFWQAETEINSVLIIQLGKSQEFNITNLKKRIHEINDILIKNNISSVSICLPQLQNQSADWQLEQMLLQVDAYFYQLLDFKTVNKKQHLLQQVDFYLPGAHAATLDNAVVIAQGIQFTRTLANLPANICTPSFLGEQAEKLAQEYSNIQCKVLDKNNIKELGMGAFLAVAQGSAEPPKLIDIHYNGAGDKAPIVLVGKGITFDSGGLSIKPANAMDEMKYDMCGAASVLGIIKICALLKLPINIIGVIASAENMVSGTAVKSGDIVNSMSGQTVEIINTDAEGRLVLADALTYVEQYNPHFVLDIATLTGAVIVALGTVASGFMTEDEELASLIENAAIESQDRVWRLPLDEAYQDAIESPLADMINAAFDRTASSITAACFLSRFTKKYRWAHLDIAGTSWVFGKNRNATGRPIQLLIQLIRNVANTY